MATKEREMLLYFASTCFGIISESKSPREAHCWTKHTYNMYEGSRGYYNQKHFGFRLLHRCLKSSSTVKKPRLESQPADTGCAWLKLWRNQKIADGLSVWFPLKWSWNHLFRLHGVTCSNHRLSHNMPLLEMTWVYQSLYSQYNSKKNGYCLQQDGCLCLRLWESIGIWNTVTGRGAGTCFQLLELDGPCLLFCTNNLEYICQSFPAHSFICRRG